jgi:hypothetical protein
LNLSALLDTLYEGLTNERYAELHTSIYLLLDPEFGQNHWGEVNNLGERKWIWDRDEDDPDNLLHSYDSIVRESALLTTFSGFLFGFLLEISVNQPEEFSVVNEVTLLVAITSITIAISLFVMPVFYHHLQYPYKDLNKFKKRAHKFLIFGFLPGGVTLYLCLVLALSSLANDLAFGIAAVPFVFIYILFTKRK